MSKTKEFFDVTKSYLLRLVNEEKPQILAAAKMMGDCMNTDGIIQLFGLDHGVAFSMELGYRAGGLMPFHQMRTSDLVLRGVITEAEYTKVDFNNDIEMAHKLLSLYNIAPHDMFCLISFAGNEALIVEVALQAKKQQQRIIAVINKRLSAAAPVLHPSGKKLSDVADLTLDVLAPNPDTVITLSDGSPFNQVSSICGNVMAQMLTAETYRYLTDQGSDCPVLLSANVKGADTHNRVISDKYLGRWNS